MVSLVVAAGTGAPNQFGYTLTAATIILRFVIYFASWAYHKSKGLDISMALKSIPPE